MTDSDGDPPSDRMYERVPSSSRWFWLVLDADRRVVASGLLGVLFVALVVGGTVLPTSTYDILTGTDSTDTLFNALVGSTITGVTLVLTLSQLVLSQELGAVGDQRNRMEGAMEFREDAARAAGMEVAPTEPSAFLRGLVAATQEQANTLADVAPDGDAGDAVEAYVDNLTGNADAVTDQLEGAQFGDFDVVWAALNYNYSWKIYAAERLRAEHGDALSEEAEDALDGLLDTLELFGPAREHFKTLYFQWALSDLSRTMLYTAIPALTVSIIAVLLFDASAYPGYTLGVNHALLIVSAAATITVMPFAILLAYILRIVTITKRTLSIGPFILRETERAGDVGD